MSNSAPSLGKKIRFLSTFLSWDTVRSYSGHVQISDGSDFRNCILVVIVCLAAPGLSCGTRDIQCGLGDLRCDLRDLLVAARGIFSCCMRILSCGMLDLVPWWGLKPRPPALGARSLSHWTRREAPIVCFY